jgi:tetratricopeptide (TPR) repeat protein
MDEMIRLGEEGLLLLSEDSECAEAALMNATIAWACGPKGDRARGQEYHRRNAAFLPRLPYAEELRAPYLYLSEYYAHGCKDVVAARDWLQSLERMAKEQRDLRLLGAVYWHLGKDVLVPVGDLSGAQHCFRQGEEVCARIGDTSLLSQCFRLQCQTLQQLGELAGAREYGERSLEMAERLGHLGGVIWSSWMLSVIALCQGRGAEFSVALRRAVGMAEPIAFEPALDLALGRVYLALGQREEALGHFRKVASLSLPGSLAFADAINGIEAASGDPGEFSLRADCRGKEAEPDGVSCISHWHLVAAEPRAGWNTLLGATAAPAGGPYRSPSPGAVPQLDEAFTGPLAPEWTWHDPFNDCSVITGNGLEIGAANGRDLWGVNQSAPRLLRAACGGIIVQTVCLRASPDRPAIGGLLMWKDRENYLRLDRGTRGPHEISLKGCLAGEDRLLGRGRLVGERVFLRVERRGGHVSGYCSIDGRTWFAVAQVAFPASDPLEVGLFASGRIDRSIDHGAYPEGTAIRFETLQIWSP